MTRNIAPFRGGERLGQRKMNDLRNAAIAQPFGSVPTGEGDLTVSGATALYLEITALATMSPWVLTCKAAGDTSPSPTLFTVIPDYLLYLPTRGASTYTYVNMNNRTKEPGAQSQFLTPEFLIGDRILAISAAGELREISGPRYWAADPP